MVGLNLNFLCISNFQYCKMHCLSSVTHVGTTVANERVGKGTYVGYRATMSSYRLSAVCGSAAVWPQF